MPRITRFAVWLVLFLAFAAFGQRFEPGPQVATFYSLIDDSDQPYGLYVPKNYTPARAWPLVVSLHGAWSNHRLNLRRVFGQGNRPGETDFEATRYFPPFRDVDFIVASPYARGTMGYQGIPERDVWDMIADLKRRFRIDEDRMYLTGLSMGGGGTLWIGLTRPDKWAAIAPVCPAAPPGTEMFAPNALNIAVHLFHGDADPAVPVEVSRKWHQRFLELGVRSEYTEYPNVKHNSWDYAYKNGAIFDWFAKQKRNRFPERVRFVTDRYEYNTAYWFRMDALKPGTPASADARFTGKNRLEIQTSELDGFTLLLEGHPEYNAREPLTVKVDGIEIKLATGLSFSRREGAWRAVPYAYETREKRQGAEGPISAAVAGRHIYVYGTADNPSPEELARRREVAQQASDWSTPRTRLHLNLRALADREVRDADLNGANIVLFGVKETNRLIAKYAAEFPLELNAGAADYGLVFVYPVDGRYVVVNSGLPWWSGAENAKRGLRFLGSKAQTLLSFGDFILFKGSLENVIAEGRFDRFWRIPVDAAAKMKATGAVVIR